MNEIRDIHAPFCRWLDKNKIPYHRNRPDKKTTAINGDPDFLCTLANRCLYIECKVPGKKLSEDQEKRVMYLRQAGNTVKIAYSFEDCIHAVEAWLGVINAAWGHPGAQNEASSASSVLDGPKSDAASGVSPQNQFIGSIGGKDYVLSGDSGPGGEAKIVRLATAADLMNLKRR